MLQNFDTELNYTLVRSPRRKRLALQIKAGELYVRATPYCRQPEIDAFIRLKRGWIRQQMQWQQRQLRQLAIETAEQGLWLLGKRVPVQCMPASHSGFVFDGQQLLLYAGFRVRPERREQRYQQQIKCWYQQQAVSWIEQRLAYWQQRMQLQCRRFFVKSWRRRWGCCNSNQELGFNWHLVKAPSWVIDYVLVHELAHLKWMDHSADFWQLVRCHYPEVDAARDWLKLHHLRLLS
ncbi:SprT family zinc-dependent metalloprotease [Alkalimonas sp.]|uniref:M48 family metallopeptidase n=1 Tax=Alkalimonas sp. TaxID=1872453 RepID=UPI00263B96E9|nr:SprT family zinc-dependent metalloprotease [Alkalimonas sp.]MCC5824763.1 M48 family metallopeptidase [Alkalimonas sp.]